MPQTNVLADWKLTYPNDAPRMKPSAVLGTVTRVPTAMAWAGNVVTATVPATTDYVGTVYSITVTGVLPSGYNGTFLGTLASPTTITYPLASNPGAVTQQGSISYQGMVPVNMSTTLPGNAVPNTMSHEEGQVLVLDKLQAAGYSTAQPVEEEVTVGDEDEVQLEEDDTEEEVQLEEDDTEKEDEDEPSPRGRRRRRR